MLLLAGAIFLWRYYWRQIIKIIVFVCHALHLSIIAYRKSTKTIRKDQTAIMKYIFYLLILCYAESCFSQSTFSIGPEIDLMSNYGNTKAGAGGSMEFDTRFTEVIGARLSFGFARFIFKSLSKYHVDYMPVRAGIQGYLSKVIFVYGEGGLVLINSDSYHDSKFSYAFGAGYNVPFGLKQNMIQVSASYNSVSIERNSYNHWFNIRIAFGLNLSHKSAPEE